MTTPVCEPRALDLSWITPALAVGGSFTLDDAPRLAADHGIAAVVDLRGEARHDAAALARHGLALLHLPTADFAPITSSALAQGVAFVAGELDAGRRVLVHCAKGIGRSVLLALCVLVERGHAPLAALELIKRQRACASPSPAQYEAWAAWLAAHRRARGLAWQVPDFDAFKAIAYRHLV